MNSVKSKDISRVSVDIKKKKMMHRYESNNKNKIELLFRNR